jgi:hypothetical protein
MPTTPYSTPIQFEYKPLNLAAFAVPLAQMQEKFDVTQALINESDVDLTHLDFGTDPVKAAELKETYRQKRDELAKNLVESGNYTQAATKLKELNRLWQTDPERKAIEYNYAARQKYMEEQQKRIDSGKDDQITRDQYYQDIARKDREYAGGQGTYWQHDPNLEKGKYNLYGTKARLSDLEKELEDMTWKVANAVDADKRAGALREIGIDPDLMDKKFAQTVIEERDPNKVAAAVSGYIKTLPRFKNWTLEVADFNYEELKATNPEGYGEKVNSLTNNALKSINSQIAEIEKESNKKGQKGLLNSDEYKQLLAYKDEIESSKATGEFDEQLIKGLYNQEALNKVYDMTALGKVFAYKKIDTDYTFRDIYIPKGSGSGSGGDDEGKVPFMMPAEDVKFNTSSVQKNIHDNATETRKYIKTAANLSGGSMRTLMLGTNKEDREAAGKNVGLMYPRMQIIQKAAINNAGNLKGFKQELKKSGIDISNDDAVKRVFNDLTSPNSSAMRELDNAIKGGKNSFSNYSIAKNNLEIVKDEAEQDDEFKIFASTLQTFQPTNEGFQRDESARLRKLKQNGQKLNSEEEKLVKIGELFDANSYSKEQLAKIGLKKENIKSNISNGFGFKPLTLNQVAKLKGYKSFKDAMLKGYDFNGVTIDSNFSISDNKVVRNSMFGSDIEGTVQNMTNKFLQHIGNKGLKTQEMAHNLINDKQSQTELSQVFSTMDKALAYAGGKTFANLPGFDEQGNPLPGSVMDYGKNRVPLITTIKGDSFVQLPYKYKTDEGTLQGTLTMPVKAGNQDYIYSIYDRVDKKTKNSSDPLDKQTNATIKVAKFNQIHGNDFNSVYANSLKVSAQRPEVKITSITIADGIGNPIEVDLVKRHPGGGGNAAYYSIKFPDGQYIGKFGSTDALKQAVMEGE